jgi:sigma-B regulation protein RsbU (phosphoserine phosphatase)
MTILGSIAIHSEASVREARKKVLSVVEVLTRDSVTATRVATATSEAARLYLDAGASPHLELSCDFDRSTTDLLLDFVDLLAPPDLTHLAGLFDRIESPRAKTEGHCLRAVVSLAVRRSTTAGEIEQLRSIVQQKSRDELISDIRLKNEELQESLDNLKRTRSVKERMESELNIGRDIQMSMLPLSFPAFPHRSDFDVHAALYPAREVGGDFYDLFLIDDNHFCFCVGDVSGKGVGAALFMAVTKTLIKSRAANDLSPASILSHVNTELAQRNDSYMFVTVFLAILDLATGELAFSNAGHNPPYLKRSTGEIIPMKQRHGPVIGASEGLAYGQDEVTLRPGEYLFLYTDGVTEAMNIEKKLYSDARLEDLLVSNPFTSVEQAVQLSVQDVWEFQGQAEQADDVTVLSVSYAGRTEESRAHRLELQIVNKLEEITRVTEAISAFCEQHDLDGKNRRSLSLVFDELLNNTISYGYDDDDDDEHVIDIAVLVADGRLVATVSDDGKPFNPFVSATPDTELSVEDRPIGGLGVHLVRNVMDKVSYERRGEHNVILLEKQLKQ